MAKKHESRPGGSLVDGLTAKLRKGAKNAAEELKPLAAAEPGLDAAAFEQDFERAHALLKSGLDPRQAITLPAPFQQALLRLAEEDQDGDVIGDLMALSDNKELKKEARRALHRLRSRGVRVEIPEDGAPSVLERRVMPEEPALPCYVSPIDSQGDKVVFLARFVHGGVLVYQATLNDQLGLVDFQGGTIGRNRYRAMIRELLAHGDEHLLEIPYAEARTLVGQAASRSREKTRALPEAYLEASPQLPEESPAAPAPDARSLYPRDAVCDAGLEKQASALLDLHEFESWHLDEETLKEISVKLEEVRTSQVLISEEQRLDQVKRIIGGAAGLMLKDGDRRAQLQQRLFDMAAHLHRAGRAEHARLAAAVAWPLTAETFKPEESAFFERLTHKLFRDPAEIARAMGSAPPPAPEPTPEPGKLIVTP